MGLLSKYTALLVLIFCGVDSRRSVELQHGISRNDMSQLGSQTLESNNEFIDSVHNLASRVAQDTEVADNFVVWSPYSVVNVLPFVNQLQDTQVLRNGYKDSLSYIKSIEGLEISRVSVGYVHENPTANVTSNEFYDTEILPYPMGATQERLLEILEEKFKNSTQVGGRKPAQNNNHSTTGKENKRIANKDSSSAELEDDADILSRTGEEIRPNDKIINLPNGTLTQETDVYLTSLSLNAGWETPFHPRYSRKSKFYLNETHAFKTKYLNNIGFYKIAELPDLNSTAVAVPIKNTQRLYFVIVLPNSPTILSNVSQNLSWQNVSELWPKFRTRRVQLSVPKITVNSQLLFTQQSGNRTSKIIQIGSMRLNYNGIETRFAATKSARTEYKLTRLRRRKEDVVFRAHHPFIFYIYDSVKAGILNYGEVIIPNYETNYKHLLKLPPPSLLSQNGKILQESLTHFGKEYYQLLRRKSHDANILVAPINLANLLGALSQGADKKTETDILRKLNFPQMWENSLNEIRSLSGPGANVSVYNESAIYTTVASKENFNQSSSSRFGVPVYDINNMTLGIHNHIQAFVGAANNTIATYSYKIEGMISSKKISTYRFYQNERDYINTSFIEYSGVAEYVSVPLWDAKILQIPMGAGKQALLLLIPDEKSGLNIIEDGLRDYPLERFLCQMQHTYVRVRIPLFDVKHNCNISEDLSFFNLTNFRGQEEFSGIGDGVRINGVIEDVQVKITAAPPNEEDSKESRRRGESKGRRLNFRRRKFQIDRPFLFFVRDINVGNLAIGRVINPITMNKPENVEIVENATDSIDTIDITTVSP